MKFLQKLGKALMLPVAVLPICGVLMGIGYLLCPATMQGGDISGAANLIGLFLVKAGGALIDNMAILFAIGVGVGMSEKNDGTGGIAALASWLMMTTLLSTGVVSTIMPSIADSATKTLAFNKIANPFIGILAGVIGSMCYNKFKDTKLPDWLAFFSGKRCVAIVAGVVSILVSAVLLFVWPLLFGALVALGDGVAKLGVVGAGIYAFLNRLLIPTGLHHALNNVFWFDTIGLGDLQHFWAGETSADVSWSLGMYMSGFFPCMMFGIPGAALAMVKCAKPEKKTAAIGLLLSAAICSFICGVTEPFEFAFMFLAPGLYVIYALLYGVFTIITVALGFRAGFSFSAGAMDLLFSASLPAAAKTWLIIPLGIAAFLVFYFVFLFAIKKFDLKTPGREDDDLEAEKKVELASDDYTAIAKQILEGCGGKDNITSIDNCVTRLRLEVKDMTAVNDKAIKAAGVAGVIKPGKTSVQIIVGTKVQFVADAFSKLCE
ncbi:MAG: N-acetylglucosamine-specific PTS transporter subunit IIBC [Lachnospiraceae bacterium]|nr:N-acetylglucosamine-specific PTS transporter subunit IIBC [Bacillota bacterium]MCI6594897.1 N-acetylglucosamine-specific PTS transporter subunit IIBC [Bacillota bacterium]MDD7253600.1 N-acetylglucosamine-specific PTS transporter subunit IIBC [Bacillota bacterium]MDY2949183.1 N-acetylglucosamine-specific PTS transporter subunit IIBC [Lachnospiraceae bacterium]